MIEIISAVHCGNRSLLSQLNAETFGVGAPLNGPNRSRRGGPRSDLEMSIQRSRGGAPLSLGMGSFRSRQGAPIRSRGGATTWGEIGLDTGRVCFYWGLMSSLFNGVFWRWMGL